jgi:uncharacterized phage-like protein YoqJ
MWRLAIIIGLLAVTPASAQWQTNNQMALQNSMDQMRFQQQMQQQQIQQQLQMQRLEMQQRTMQCTSYMVGNVATTRCF